MKIMLAKLLWSFYLELAPGTNKTIGRTKPSMARGSEDLCVLGYNHGQSKAWAYQMTAEGREPCP